jgi:hypothetical protein
MKHCTKFQVNREKKNPKNKKHQNKTPHIINIGGGHSFPRFCHRYKAPWRKKNYLFFFKGGDKVILPRLVIFVLTMKSFFVGYQTYLQGRLYNCQWTIALIFTSLEDHLLGNPGLIFSTHTIFLISWKLGSVCAGMVSKYGGWYSSAIPEC